MPIPTNSSRPRAGLRRRLARISVLAACLALGGALTVAPTAAAQSGSSAAMPKLDHVFVILEENNAFSDAVGNPAAPHLNFHPTTFCPERHYFTVSPRS